eukprot:Hpha_TRINITY_DN11149_c1_g1::TRINITY_DN11149_c1_g1_i1::g.28116::m.28116
MAIGAVMLHMRQVFYTLLWCCCGVGGTGCSSFTISGLDDATGLPQPERSTTRPLNGKYTRVMPNPPLNPPRPVFIHDNMKSFFFYCHDPGFNDWRFAPMARGEMKCCDVQQSNIITNCYADVYSPCGIPRPACNVLLEEVGTANNWQYATNAYSAFCDVIDECLDFPAIPVTGSYSEAACYDTAGVTQECNDPDTSPSVLSDWTCSCTGGTPSSPTSRTTCP